MSAQPDGQINDKTLIPLSVMAGVVIILIPLVAWAVRLEGKVESKVPKEQYIQDMADLKSDLRSIKTHFHIKEE